MNLPNKITTIRIVLIPFIMAFYLISVPYFKLVSLVLFIACILTDFLDGKIARKYNLITTLGTFLDSIADKMVVIVALALVVADGTIISPFGVIALSIVVVRELIISALRQLSASKGIVMSADKMGKYKAAFQFFAVAVFMLYSFLAATFIMSEVLTTILLIVAYSLLGVAIVLTIMSGVHYLIKNKGVFSE